MTQQELGDLVPCNKAAVSRIEAGITTPDRHFAEVCAAAFNNPWFVRFWDDSRTWDAPPDAELLVFSGFEARAVTLRLFEHTLMPGLFQVEPYARAVLERHPYVTAADVDGHVTDRMARQSVLDQETPPVVYALLDESVLYREIGSPKIMHEQLTRLLELAARPRVIVQLMAKAGAHVGLSGSTALAETPDVVVANFADFVDGRTTDSPATVATAIDRFDILRADAYRRSESLLMIEAAAEQWQP